MFSYASVKSVRIVFLPLRSPGLLASERRWGRDLIRAPDARYRSQVHASRQLRSLIRWMFDVINSSDINGDGLLRWRNRGMGGWFKMVKRRCAWTGLPFNTLFSQTTPLMKHARGPLRTTPWFHVYVGSFLLLHKLSLIVTFINRNTIWFHRLWIGYVDRNMSWL